MIRIDLLLKEKLGFVIIGESPCAAPMQSVRLPCTRVTSPVHPKPFAAERRHRVHSPVDEHPKLGLIVPRGQRSGVQAGPVGFVSTGGRRFRRYASRCGYP